MERKSSTACSQESVTGAVSRTTPALLTTRSSPPSSPRHARTNASTSSGLETSATCASARTPWPSRTGGKVLDRRFDVAHGDVGAGLGEADGERPTQSPRRAGDDRPPLVERTAVHRSVTGRFQHVCMSPCCRDRSAGCRAARQADLRRGVEEHGRHEDDGVTGQRIPRARAVLRDRRVDRRLAEPEGDPGAQPVGSVLPAWLPLAEVLALHEELVRVGERPRIAVGGCRRAHDRARRSATGARTARPRGGRSAAPTGPAWSGAAPRGRPT